MHYIDAHMDVLRKYVRLDQPFGPPDAAEIAEPVCVAALYEWNNKAFADMLEGSDVLVGRRGSGKSSLLSSFPARKLLLREFDSDEGREFRERYNIPSKVLNKIPNFVVDVDTPKHVDEFELYCKQQAHLPLVEVLADMWRKRLWWLIGCEIEENTKWREKLPDDIRSYICHDDIKRISGTDPKAEHVLLTENQYQKHLENFLIKHSLRIIVTFDNIEEHKFQEVQNAVLGGLIAATGKFIGSQHPCVDVKLCLPAEHFRQLQQISFRPDKDLHNVQYLHWSAAELLQIVARRLGVYLSLWNNAEFSSIQGLKMANRTMLMEFWHRYLPETIINSVGVKESSITYILRHTQMLPRQIISVLNAICKRLTGNGDILFSRRFTDHEIIKGVEDSESSNVQAVLFMFRRLYTEIDDLFSAVMPRLTREFDYGRLQSVWHSSGKTYMASMGKPEFISFWQLMFATGAIGLRVDNDGRSEIYSVARFEFNTKHVLSISDKDSLCVHPLFSRIYNLERNGNAKIILPRGADFQNWVGV